MFRPLCFCDRLYNHVTVNFSSRQRDRHHYNNIYFNISILGDHIKEDEMNGTCGTYVGAYRMLAKNHKGKIPLGRLFVTNRGVL